MPKGFGDVLRPDGGDVADLVQAGRLAELLCRLARDRFTGLVYAETDDAGGAVLSLRDGRVVFVEDLGDEQSIPDMLLERDLLTAQQYAEIATRVLESGADNEDVAFCEQAVQMRVLSQAQVDSELERRIRGRVIKAVGWEGCRVELDTDPDSVSGVPEHPQAIEPLVYTGVRTFYDDERVRAMLSPGRDLYVRLAHDAREVAGRLALEAGEAALLSRLRPDVPFAKVLEASDTEPLEGWQLLCMLVLANLAEVGSKPFAPLERSGVRSTEQMHEAARGASARGPHAARGDSPHEAPARAGRRAASQPRVPATGTYRHRPASEDRIPAAAVETRAGASRPRMPAVAGNRAPMPRSAQVETAAPPVSAAEPRASQPSSRPVRRERRQPRKLSAALQRLDRDLKQLKPGASPADAASPSQPQPAGAGQGRALEQLVRMRIARQHRQATPQNLAASERGAAELFRAGQDALRDQQFARAHELLRKACEAAPNDEVYAMYCAWAGFRAGALSDDELGKLRLRLREKVSDDQHKGFAYYALGHIAIHERKDEAAEKFFRRAVELDKHNKDAERHLRIIELRRKTAAAEERANKIFGIEIRKKS